MVVKSLDLLVTETNEIIDMKKRKDIKDMEERVHLLQDIVSSLNADLQEKSSCIASLNIKIDELVTRYSEKEHEDKEKIELLSDGNQSLQQLLNQSSDEINALKKVNKQLGEEMKNLKTNSRPEEESGSVDACDNSSIMEDRFNQLDQKILNLNNNFVQLLINTNISHKRDSGRRFNTVASKKKTTQKASSLFYRCHL
jgi:predicted RNase H-like nuclease (RuvC/YqgF family)